MKSSALEVKLVSDVRNCKTCQWFWGAVPPYGNFPVFDWNEDYPKEVRDQHQTLDYISQKPTMKVKACGEGQVDSGIMHGCRKAPIMTIGINPNMTAYFPSEAGAVWAYPNLSKNERYAYYYRHHNVYQESLGIEFIKENIKNGTEIIAEQDGWLLDADRCSDHRWLLLTIAYIDGTEKQIEVAWTDQLRFVVLVDTKNKKDSQKLSFKKGEVIGAKIDGLTGANKQLYENSTGYYQRYVNVLNQFKTIMKGQPVAKADLSISEDVAQHDMIACASPGWSSKYDIPTQKITKNCVIDNAFVVSQLIQTRPAVIVIVGGSSMEMFAKVFGHFLTDFDYYYEVEKENGEKIKVIKETYQLLKETTEREKFLNIKTDDYELKSRIVISPHFSYSSNFVEQARLSDAAWQAFQADFIEDTQILMKAGRVQENSWNSIVPIRIHGKDDHIKQQLSAPAWDVLMAYYYDPINMLADVLKQEYDAKRISYDASISRLKRTEGACQFCVNDLWQFPEGCPYDKNTETPPAQGELESVVKEVIATH
ncbi:hypothetical protein EMN47_05915 [Prolixibacteraceae bacterium JC049]|nr:hypothetical protein [Prolixibacteraceae bacterium JC049]